jgi:iron complex transport system substrate-binding protein
MYRRHLLKKILLLILLLILLTSTGCKSSVKQTANTTDNAVLTSANLNTMPEHPHRVALLTTSLVEFWVTAGGKDSVVACPLSGVQDGQFKTLFNQHVVDTGTSGVPNLEKILSASPDLVLGLANYTPTSDLNASFQNAGIPYLEIKLDNLDDNFKVLRLFGKFTGHTSLAEQKIKEINEEIKIEQQRHTGKKRPKALMLWSTNNAVLMVTPSSKHGELLNLAGGDNIVPDVDTSLNKNLLSMEYIVDHQPDIIFLEMRGNPDKAKNKAKLELFDNTAWQNLKAVQVGRVYVLPEEIFSVNPGLRSGKAITYLGHLLYP